MKAGIVSIYPRLSAANSPEMGLSLRFCDLKAGISAGKAIKPPPCWDLRVSGQPQADHFLLDRPKDHRLAFAVVSISARVWIYACLRISICKRDKQMRV